MRKIFFLSIHCFFVSTLYSQSKVEFISITKRSDHGTLYFGLTYDTKRGKIKKRGGYFQKSFRSKKFGFSVKGADIGLSRDGYKLFPILVTNKALLEKNNNQIVVSYHHPKNKKIKKTDTISFPEIENIKFNASPSFTYGDNSKYDFISTVKNREEYNHNYVEFVLSPKTNILENDTLPFGLLYGTKKGRIKKRGGYFEKSFRSKKFDFSVKGAKISLNRVWLRASPVLVTNKALLEENNNQITISYRHPKNKKAKKTDTIFFPKVDDIKLMVPQDFTLGDKSKFDFTLTLKNGEEYNYDSDRFLFMLDRHNIDFTLENLSIENGLISAPNCSYDGLKKAYGKIIFYLGEKKIEQKINFNFNLNRMFSLKERAKPKKTKRWFTILNEGGDGGRGLDASDLQLDIAYVSDTIGHITIKHKYLNREFFFKLDSSRLYFDISGENGKNGKNGASGSDGSSSSPSGGNGGDGGNGGNGGNGGDCIINIDERIAYFTKDIKIINEGGKGGRGGYGGSGGSDYVDGKCIFNVLFSSSGDDGNDGYDGHSGNKGGLHINTILLDYKE